MALKSIPKLKKDLQLLVNRYCRIRDCKGEVGGVCISCGRYYPFARLQGGHFVPKTASLIRFDERNINAQCVGCNMFKGGYVLGYFPAMEKKYGRAVVDELLSKKHELKGWKRWELEAMINEYHQKNKTLLDEYR